MRVERGMPFSGTNCIVLPKTFRGKSLSSDSEWSLPVHTVSVTWLLIALGVQSHLFSTALQYIYCASNRNQTKL